MVASTQTYPAWSKCAQIQKITQCPSSFIASFVSVIHTLNQFWFIWRHPEASSCSFVSSNLFKTQSSRNLFSSAHKNTVHKVKLAQEGRCTNEAPWSCACRSTRITPTTPDGQPSSGSLWSPPLTKTLAEPTQQLDSLHSLSCYLCPLDKKKMVTKRVHA